jgi:hypothetical protein
MNQKFEVQRGLLLETVRTQNQFLGILFTLSVNHIKIYVKYIYFLTALAFLAQFHLVL